mgnify:CR=1 FL=1
MLEYENHKKNKLIEENINKLKDISVMNELQFTFKYLKYLINISDNKDEIKKTKALQKEENTRIARDIMLRRGKNLKPKQKDMALPELMIKELFEKHYDNLKTIFKSLDSSNSKEISPYISVSIGLDFQELNNYFLENKFKLDNKCLIDALACGHLELAKSFILNGCILDTKALDNVIKNLIDYNDIVYLCFNFESHNWCNHFVHIEYSILLFDQNESLFLL